MPTDHLRARVLRSAPVLVALAAGCPEPAPLPQPMDAAVIRRDIGPIDAFMPDMGPLPDTGPRPDAWELEPDAPRVDAGRDGGAGSTGVVVDGRLTDRAWASAIERTTAEPSFGVFSGVQITRFLVLRTADELAIAVEGSFPVESNVVAVYLDLSYPDLADGVLLASSGLGDRTGAVDTVLSNSIVAIDATFRPELGWGTGRRPEPITTGSPTLGWRALSQTGPHVLVPSQRSACTASACESTLSLMELSVPPSATLALAVRLGDPTQPDLWAVGQTIPTDSDAEFISIVESIPPAM